MRAVVSLLVVVSARLFAVPLQAPTRPARASASSFRCCDHAHRYCFCRGNTLINFEDETPTVPSLLLMQINLTCISRREDCCDEACGINRFRKRIYAFRFAICVQNIFKISSNIFQISYKRILFQSNCKENKCFQNIFNYFRIFLKRF